MTILKLSDPELRIRTASTYASQVNVLPIAFEIPMLNDTLLNSNQPTNNFISNIGLNIGESNAAASISRSLIQPDFSSIPTGATIISSFLKMTPTSDLSSNARTMYAHRVLRNVVYNQTTWNIFSTGNDWGTAGCSNSTTDYDGAIVLGSQVQPASPTLNSADSFVMELLASEIQKLFDGTYTNNGIVLFVDTQNNDLIQYASMDNATSAYRPKITGTYLP